ncbi:alpha/beta hydrolase [Paenibacillus sp.]|uniref:alpha/beta fold hydrolase n=1 Tax=Paenibacillus sp. TaxID=58172 RepID=UPI002D5D0BB5|nr:alpha/beta hydrolase [Paenibacillus sp.]HZG88060.1 alpha/beta hydrolase [Paenibacillus sp.]
MNTLTAATAATPLFKSIQHELDYMAAYEKTLELWNVPVESMRVRTSYGITHMLVCGPKNGQPILLFNGFGFSAAMWYPTAEALAASGRRVYAVDVLGEFNRSAASRHFHAKLDYVGWLTELMDRLGLEKAVFGGHSNGGWHALNFAIHEPSRVEKLILLAPAASFTKFNKQFGLRLFAASLIRTRSMIVDSFCSWFVGPGKTVDPRLFEQFYRGLVGFGWKHKIVIPSVFSDEELSRVTMPVLLLVGDREVIYDYRKAIAGAKRTVPHARACVVPGAGHALSIECADQVNGEIAAFLTNESNNH